MEKNFAELDLQLVMFDMNDTEEEREDNVVAGVAIRAEDAAAFAADVERLAGEKYGGATFADLLEEDPEDESMAAQQCEAQRGPHRRGGEGHGRRHAEGDEAATHALD